jgi:hypothetical protein
MLAIPGQKFQRVLYDFSALFSISAAPHLSPHAIPQFGHVAIIVAPLNLNFTQMISKELRQ